MDGLILMIIILVQFLPTDLKLIEKIHYIDNEGVKAAAHVGTDK